LHFAHYHDRMLTSAQQCIENNLPPVRQHGPAGERAFMPKVSVDVGANVPVYGQEKGNYCGETNAQMARDGYPDRSDRIYYRQKYLHNIIRAQNSALPADKCHWNTDPQGLQGCLQLLSNPPVNWVVLSNSQRDETELFIMQRIEQTRFPVPVLVNGGRHWVLVVGWETEVPLGGGNAELKYIHFHDPEPLGKGSDITATARAWHRTRFSAVRIGGTWHDNFVAVGQRP
jgi:hypothetical protein